MRCGDVHDRLFGYRIALRFDFRLVGLPVESDPLFRLGPCDDPTANHGRVNFSTHDSRRDCRLLY